MGAELRTAGSVGDLNAKLGPGQGFWEPGTLHEDKHGLWQQAEQCRFKEQPTGCSAHHNRSPLGRLGQATWLS